MIEVVLSDWKVGHDWRAGGSQRTKELAPDDISIDPLDPDARSLRATRGFITYFIFEMDHSDPNLDGLAWDDAVAVLEEAGRRLRAEIPIDDMRVLRYIDLRTPEQRQKNDRVRKHRQLGCLCLVISFVAVCIAIYREMTLDAIPAILFGVMAAWCFGRAEYLRRKP